MGQIEQYLNRVAPLAEGEYISVHRLYQKGDNRGKGMPGVSCHSIAAAAQEARLRAGEGLDVYLCMGGQRELGIRNQADRSHPNIYHLKSLFLDLDQKNFSSKSEMDTALKSFHRTSGFPLPNVVVGSGSGGYHLYWIFSRLVSVAEWEPVAKALVTLAKHVGLNFDSGCTIDRTRVLRIPETQNHKNSPPTDVKLLYDDLHEYEFEQLRDFLTGSSLEGEDDDDAKNMGVNDNQTWLPADIELVRKECGFINVAIDTGGRDHDNTLWHASVHLASFTINPYEAAHIMSKGHRDYGDGSETTQELERVKRDKALRSIGPHRCSTIESMGSKQCAGCKHRGSQSSPISYGRKPINGHTYNPNSADSDLPTNYYRGKNNWIWKQPIGEDPATVIAFAIPIQTNSARLERGEPYRFTFETVEGKEVRTIRILQGLLTDASAASKEFGNQGCSINYTKHTKDFFVAFLDKLKHSDNLIRLDPIGWDGDGFSFNGKHVSPEGVTACKAVPPQFKYGVKGDEDAWDALSNIIIDPNRLDLSCLVAAGFAAPLVVFTGHSGFLIGGQSNNSGVGKTTAMRLSQAIWGSPAAMSGHEDTYNYLIDVIASLKNLPAYVDEIRGQQQIDKFLKTITSLTSGKEKGRSDRTGAARTVREWKTIIEYAANQSMLAAAENYKAGGLPLIYRMLELPCGGSKVHKDADVQRISGRLDQNYGHIGAQYAAYLGTNRALIEQMIIRTQDWFDTKLTPKEGERFWFAAATTLTVGSAIARQQGYAPFKPQSIRDYLVDVIGNLRGQVKTSTSNYTNIETIGNILAGFVRDHFATNLLITDKIIADKGRPKKDGVQVLNEGINKRIDVAKIQIGKTPHKMRFARSTIKDWCDRHGHDWVNFDAECRKQLAITAANARVGSGTRYSTEVTEFCWTIEMADLEKIMQPVMEEALNDDNTDT